jgi:5-methylcytosine-specific restriction enzyme B
MVQGKQGITAQEIRIYCRDKYVKPARENGEKVVSIRVGDVHKDLNLKSRFGSVDDAIGANIFQEIANVRRISKSGPPHAPNAIFVFEILTS